MKKSYQAWLQGASVADATSEIEVLKAEAASLLDKHLSKTADEASEQQPEELIWRLFLHPVHFFSADHEYPHEYPSSNLCL